MDSINYIFNILPLLLKGVVTTVELSALAIFFGTFIGLAIALAKISKNPLLNMAGRFYTWIFRGIPLLVQLIFIYYALPSVGIEFTEFESAVIGLSLCGGAYIAEIIRAAILSIDKGQMEAALSLGMTYAQAMRRIIIPQTYRRLIPPMGNEFITLTKDTALVSAIAMTEILRHAQIRAAADFRPLENYAAAALLYLALTTIFTIVFNKVENKLALSE
ncbi:MAG: amino acid ABC transporter permease [Bacillota bacterium]|uniref:ABC transporter permease subunit n=1 Tax=Thermanaerosceptrum fracticalcis TaxID=1712410 RepID=A0A7G6E5E4_THEFR|nr:amino acid ABC transporter permease [Thermanaerosceptrum fracticalcis]QNB47298.1 ABC transporter permease subunit [Thermanaerosceptrum fracticalcis]